VSRSRRGDVMIQLRTAVQRALKAQCEYDFLRVHRALVLGRSRRASTRLTWLAEFAISGRMGNSKQLAQIFGCSEKAIQRDLEHLRDHFGYQINYDALHYCYVCPAAPQVPRPMTSPARGPARYPAIFPMRSGGGK